MQRWALGAKAFITATGSMLTNTCTRALTSHCECQSTSFISLKIVHRSSPVLWPFLTFTVSMFPVLSIEKMLPWQHLCPFFPFSFPFRVLFSSHALPQSPVGAAFSPVRLQTDRLSVGGCRQVSLHCITSEGVGTVFIRGASEDLTATGLFASSSCSTLFYASRLFFLRPCFTLTSAARWSLSPLTALNAAQRLQGHMLWLCCSFYCWDARLQGLKDPVWVNSITHAFFF